MRGVVATAQIFSEAGKPATGLDLIVEVFILDNNTWTAAGKGRTDTKGSVGINVDARKIETNAVPARRLVEDGAPEPRVLSMSGLVKYDKRRDTLRVDFGQIDRLEETAFKLPTSTSGFTQIKHTVAGVALQEGRNEAALNRNLREVSGARDSLATVTRAREDVIVADVSRGGVIADSSRTLDGTLAVASTKEIDTLKSINHEQNQRIIVKDQELATSRAEILQKTTQIQTIQTALTAAQKSASEEKARADALAKAAGIKADVGGIVAGLGTRLSIANETLKAQAHPFRVGTIKLDLRGRPSADGSEIELGGDAEKSGSGVSTELHVDQSRTADDVVTVPDVLGLTESAARRVIRSVGLRLAPARQTLKAGTGTPGQSISQHPKAGETTRHGSEVLVVFGAAPTE